MDASAPAKGRFADPETPRVCHGAANQQHGDIADNTDEETYVAGEIASDVRRRQDEGGDARTESSRRTLGPHHRLLMLWLAAPMCILECMRGTALRLNLTRKPRAQVPVRLRALP